MTCMNGFRREHNGFKYRRFEFVINRCFSLPINSFHISLNDFMTDSNKSDNDTQRTTVA
jgi:hypothetical protein